MQEPPHTYEEILRRAITKTTDILLSPATTSQFFFYHNNLKKFGVNLGRTNYIDFFEMSSILSKNKLESRPLFECFRCFDVNIWTLIMTSILAFSLLSWSRQPSFYNLYQNVWNYSISLLNVNIQNFPKTLIDKSKIKLGAWLFLAFLLNTTFVSYFFDYLILPTPITKIDTIEQLFDSDMRIVARKDCALYQYLLSSKSEQIDRVDLYTDYSIIKDKLFVGLRTGSHAYVNHKYILVFVALDFNSMYKRLKLDDISNQGKDLINCLHISKDGGVFEPYYMLTNGDLDTDINNDLTDM